MALLPCPECKKEVSSEADACPFCGFPIRQTPAEPQFEAYRRRVLIGSLVLCFAGLAAGIALSNPYVWGLSLAGIVIASRKLAWMGRAK